MPAVDHVDGAIAYDLEGDTHVTVARVADGKIHGTEATANQGPPGRAACS